MKDVLNSIIHDCITFYSSLNPVGVILFYAILSIIVLLIIMLGIMERNRSFEEKNNKMLPAVAPDITPVVNNNIEQIENNKYQDIVEEVSKRNIVDLNSITKKMEQDIDEKNILLTPFEEEQEENSIISYDELLSHTTRLTKNDIENGMKETLSLRSSDILNSEPNIEERKFSNSPLISPIYGIRQVEPIRAKEGNNDLEKTLNIQNLSSEIRKNNEFLKALKDLKNSLD